PVAVVPTGRAVAALLTRELVAPVAERALGELLDVALVHQRDGLAIMLHGVLDRGSDQPLRPGLRHRLDADAGVGPDVPSELGLEDVDQLLRLGRALLH